MQGHICLHRSLSTILQSEPEFAPASFLHPSPLIDGLFTFSASEQRKSALTHVILVAGGVLIRQPTAINTIVPVVVTTDDSGHARDWGNGDTYCDLLYTFTLGLYSDMLA